jgi:hypothetical protein
MAVMVNDTTKGSVGRLKRFSEKWSMHPGVPFWLHTPFCDPYKIPPERLHFMDAGIIAWVISALVCMIRVLWKGAEQNAKVRELDRRFQSIPKFPGLRVFTQGVSTCCKYTAVEWVSMVKVLVCVVPGLFPPERQVTQLCVKLSVMYMDMRRADMNDDEIETARKNAIAFKDQALFTLSPVLDKVSRGDLNHMSTCIYLHVKMYNSSITYCDVVLRCSF